MPPMDFWVGAPPRFHALQIRPGWNSFFAIDKANIREAGFTVPHEAGDIILHHFEKFFPPSFEIRTIPLSPIVRRVGDAISHDNVDRRHGDGEPNRDEKAAASPSLDE